MSATKSKRTDAAPDGAYADAFWKDGARAWQLYCPSCLNRIAAVKTLPATRKCRGCGSRWTFSVSASGRTIQVKGAGRRAGQL